MGPRGIETTAGEQNKKKEELPPVGTSLRELRGLVITAIGPSFAEYKSFPHTDVEILEILKLKMQTSEVEVWHKARLREIAGEPALKEHNFRGICVRTGALLLDGHRRTNELRFWAETSSASKGTAGLLPRGIHNERHLLNTAFSKLKSAIEALEMVSKSPALSIHGNPAKLMAAEYFKRIYLLVMILLRIAYSKEFQADYFEPFFTLPLDACGTQITFNKLSPLGDYDDESEILDVCPATVHDAAAKIPVRHHIHRQVKADKIPHRVVNIRAYGDGTVPNALALRVDDLDKGRLKRKAEAELRRNDCFGRMKKRC